jgi:hypothetical protein
VNNVGVAAESQNTEAMNASSHSAKHAAIIAINNDGGEGVRGISARNVGVVGESDTGRGVMGISKVCLTDFGETAGAVVQSQLKQKRFDCILSGAGVRTNPSNFMLFEKLINMVHENAPQAKLCFNTMPSDTAAAVQRWL